MVELAIIVPTFNERDNVGQLLASLENALAGIEYEVIFVDDDSPDGTASLVRELSLANPRVRGLQRIGRRGLSSACVEGMLSTAAPYIAVLDADLQHDEAILPEMFSKVRTERLDLVVATRNAQGGSMGDFSTLRLGLSHLGKRLSSSISHCSLTDPMSGFFVIDRRFLEEVVHSISGIGFKVLLDIVAFSNRPVRLGEVPYVFRPRLHGESKLDTLLFDKKIGGFVPTQFLIFGMVGLIGATAHLAVLVVLLEVNRRSFVAAQTVATIVAMTVNFFLNNIITYRDRRLRGSRLVFGLLSFYLACSIGALVNVRVAALILNNGAPLGM